MKNFLVILLVLSTVTLCLAKPKWIWLREEEKNGGNFNDEVFARKSGKDEEKPMTKPKCYPPGPHCPPLRLRRKQQ
jgi:hypothetical protein